MRGYFHTGERRMMGSWDGVMKDMQGLKEAGRMSYEMG